MTLPSLKYYFALLTLASISSCSSEAGSEITSSTLKSFDSAAVHFKSEIKDGALVMRLGNDITSNMLAQLNPTEKRFSHVGVAFWENKNLMVYHAVGAENHARNPIQKQTIEQFFKVENNLSLGYANTLLAPKELKKLQDTIGVYYRNKIPFDLAFDHKSDSALYCSEMVAKAFCSIGANFRVPFTDTLGKQYYAIDNLINHPWVGPVQYYTRSHKNGITHTLP